MTQATRTMTPHSASNNFFWKKMKNEEALMWCMLFLPLLPVFLNCKKELGVRFFFNMAARLKAICLFVCFYAQRIAYQ